MILSAITCTFNRFGYEDMSFDLNILSRESGKKRDGLECIYIVLGFNDLTLSSQHQAKLEMLLAFGEY